MSWKRYRYDGRVVCVEDCAHAGLRRIADTPIAEQAEATYAERPWQGDVNWIDRVMAPLRKAKPKWIWLVGFRDVVDGEKQVVPCRTKRAAYRQALALVAEWFGGARPRYRWADFPAETVAALRAAVEAEDYETVLRHWHALDVTTIRVWPQKLWGAPKRLDLGFPTETDAR